MGSDATYSAGYSAGVGAGHFTSNPGGGYRYVPGVGRGDDVAHSDNTNNDHQQHKQHQHQHQQYQHQQHQNRPSNAVNSSDQGKQPHPLSVAAQLEQQSVLARNIARRMKQDFPQQLGQMLQETFPIQI